MKSRDVTVSDLFTIQRGKSKYTRAYGDAHPGDVPVYSASLVGPMTYVDSADFSGCYLTFTTNGYGGSVQILDGDFSINADRAVLVPRDSVSLPDYRYLARVLEQAFRPLAIGRVVDNSRNEFTKLRPDVAVAATIPFLVAEDGTDDFAAMERFGSAADRVDALQANLQARAEQIRTTDVILEAGVSTEVRLGDNSLFHRSIGKRVLIADLIPDGPVPVYSASVRKTMGYTDAPRATDTFDAPSLIWGIDWLFDWNLIPAGQPFVPTDHCGVLRVLRPDLDPEYLLYALRATRSDPGFDRVFRANLKNVAELTVQVPVDTNGHFDLARQRALAARYRRLNRIGDDLLAKLDALTEVVVTPEL